jgi:homoaconitase/3-isopropylmalate dehydratase large subunit
LAWQEKDRIRIGELMDKDAAPVDQIFIGGDTACRYHDFENGLQLIRYQPLSATLTACLLPGSQLVSADLLDTGIAGILTEIGFQIYPSAFLLQIVRFPDLRQTRLATSVRILNKGGMLASAASCFAASVNGAIAHPTEIWQSLQHHNKTIS